MENRPTGETPPPPRGAPARFWLYLAIGAALLWVGYLNVFGPKQLRLLENSGLSQPAAYDWPLLDLKDEPVSFSRFKGKPVFLNIWATWCGPCVHEMPSIAELARDPRLNGKNIEFVCVSTDESTDEVRRFLAGKDWSMTFLRAEQIPPVFSTEGIPATFIIAPDGRIVGSEIGSADWHEPGVVKFLETLGATK